MCILYYIDIWLAVNVLCIFTNLIVVYLCNYMYTAKECVYNKFLIKMHYKYLLLI